MKLNKRRNNIDNKIINEIDEATLQQILVYSSQEQKN